MTWKKFKEGLAKAFSCDDGREDIKPEDIALLDKVAAFVVRRKMVTPALLVLESTAPLNFIGSSVMTFFRPVVALIFNTTDYERFERMLEHRCSIKLLAERIELLDREAAERGKKPDAETRGRGDAETK
jgi:hypothetical protein